MAFSDPPNDLEHLIADAMGPALEGARRSLAEQIRRRNDSELRDARERGVHDLRDAVTRLDAARDQPELLQALLEEGARFASRTALLLTFVDGARGWATHGFGGGARGMDDLHLAYDEPFMQELAQGRGTVTLDAAQAAALAQRLGGSAPRAAVLVPLVLRGRVAAALYGDRLHDEDALATAALQLLVLAAAHLLELQGTREHRTTPTLAGAGAAAASQGLPLWDPAAVERNAPAPAERAATAVATPEEIASPSSAPIETGSAQPAVEEPVAAGWEPQPSSPPEPAWVETPTTAAEPAAAPEPQWNTEDEPTSPGFAPMPSAVEPAAAGEEAWVYTDQSHDGAGAVESTYEEVEAQGYAEATMEELPALPEPDLESLPDLGSEPPVAPQPPPAEEARDASQETTDRWRTPAMTPPDSSTSQLYPSAPEPQPIYPSEATVRISRDLLPATPPADADVSDDRTVMLNRQQAAAPSAAAPPAAAPPAPARRDELDETHTRPQAAQPRQAPVFGGMGGGGSTEVQPPPDLEGPGWAFRSESLPAATAPHRQMSEETSALHEEARRLARLLVSEIKLYNEEQVEEGRRQRDIYPRLQEDIDRSRQMYEERVDPRVRDEVDYFQQEMVNILAGGDAGALGL